jgi:amidohydrolase
MSTLPDSLLREITAFRHDLHAHPELGLVEFRTSDQVAAFLATCPGIKVHRGLAGTAVVGVLKCGDSPRMIGLRADMDALPIHELNTFPHHSRIDGTMHACGHDGHTAMLLGAARHLSETRRFNGTVVFIFQPAEETVGGARIMLEEGFLAQFPIAAVYGMHNWPGLPVGQIAVHNGPVMACADSIDISVRGHGAHAAMPHLGSDVILAASQLVSAIQAIAARATDPMEAIVVSITRFHAGEAYNVLPEEAQLGGTVRAFQTTLRDQAEALLTRMCHGIAAAHGVQIQLDYRRGYPPTVNHAAAAEHCAQVAATVVGAAQVRRDLNPSMGAEDFAYFLLECPGCYVWLGNGPGGDDTEHGGCTLHNPHYDFNDAATPTGIRYWVALAEDRLSAA